MKKNNKYEGEYFSHWLAMYDLHQEDWTKESIEQQIGLYKNIEGDEEYENLKEEIKQIIQNKDFNMFVDKAKNEIKISDLEFMANEIVTSGSVKS
jgi:hypothetical protein